MIRIIISSVFIFVLSLTNTFAQEERKMVREGVKEYQNDQYSEAEVNFRKALDAKPELFEADYNIANSLYKQGKYAESVAEFDKLIQKSNDPEKRADIYHNLGNSHIMTQEFEKGIEAYKNALRIRPDDEDTRYNLAYAMQMLKEQQKQDKSDQKNNEGKEDKQNREGQGNKEQQQQQDNKQDNKKGEQEIPEQQLSQQEAEQMLNAILNQEKEVKAKVDKKKAAVRPVATEKDW